MNQKDVANWGEFEGELELLLSKQCGKPSQLLFRGQRDSTWRLETTLERHGWINMPVTGYYRTMARVVPHVEALTGMTWNVPEYPDIAKLLSEYEAFDRALLGGRLPAYDCMAHLRHHGFPSPLLDWTRSSRIAAFYAFRNARGGMVSI